MSRISVAPIVEGHGEVAAAPLLLRRIWTEVVGGEYMEVLRPIRDKRNKLAANKDNALCNAINLAARKLDELPAVAPQPGLILVLLDADRDLPCQLAPELSRTAHDCRSDRDISCVIANVEYETWFVAAADSLDDYLNVPADDPSVRRPEAGRCGKKWIERHFRGVRYSPTVDQPRMTARMDLGLCRQRSPSFDKLCRELQRRLTT